MARTKFTFEKRQRERARQQKQQEKVARRTEAKQLKSGMEPEGLGDDASEPGVGPEAPSLPVTADTVDHEQELSR
jgi:hypothetical protein